MLISWVPALAQKLGPADLQQRRYLAVHNDVIRFQEV
jgi:hypothetical protein